MTSLILTSLIISSLGCGSAPAASAGADILDQKQTAQSLPTAKSQMARKRLDVIGGTKEKLKEIFGIELKQQEDTGGGSWLEYSGGLNGNDAPDGIPMGIDFGSPDVYNFWSIKINGEHEGIQLYAYLDSEWKAEQIFKVLGLVPAEWKKSVWKADDGAVIGDLYSCNGYQVGVSVRKDGLFTTLQLWKSKSSQKEQAKVAGEKLVDQFGKKRSDFEQVLGTSISSHKDDARKLPGSPASTDYVYNWQGYRIMLSAEDQSQHVIEMFITPKGSKWADVKVEIATLLELSPETLKGKDSGGNSVDVTGIPGAASARLWSPEMGGTFQIEFPEK